MRELVDERAVAHEFTSAGWLTQALGWLHFWGWQLTIVAVAVVRSLGQAPLQGGEARQKGLFGGVDAIAGVASASMTAVTQA